MQPFVRDMQRVQLKPRSLFAPWSSAIKPAPKIAPWRKRTAQQRPDKPVLRSGKFSALRAHRDNIEYLDQTVQEICSVFREVFDSKDCVVTERISWRCCWGRLQPVLSGIYGDLLRGTSDSLSDESRNKLAYIAGLVKAKLFKAHELMHEDQCVLLSRAEKLLQCMQEVVKATVHVVSWHGRLDELLCYDDGSVEYYKAQSLLIEQRLDEAQRKIKSETIKAKKIGLGLLDRPAPEL